MMKKLTLCTFLMSCTLIAFSQTQHQKDSTMLRAIYDKALTDGQSYQWLEHLSLQIGARLSGSLEAEEAVQYTKEELEDLALDKVWLQPVMVPKWVRGIPEYAYIQTGPNESKTVNICALGGSAPTPQGGLKAPVIEVKGLEEVRNLPKDSIAGKIVFYNRPMDPKLIETFSAYGGCVDQRYSGAKEAALKGAVGVIVRSMSLKIDEHPHTRTMSYGDLPLENRIPAAAISTKDANYLSKMLKLQPL